MAYQLGQLFGFVFGLFVAALFLTSSKRMPDAGRRTLTRIALGCVGFAVVAHMLVKMATTDENRLLSEFNHGCVNGCVQQGTAADRCAAYCDCELAALAKGRSRTQTVTWMGTHMNHGRPDAEFIRAATDAAQLCLRSIQPAAAHGP